MYTEADLEAAVAAGAMPATAADSLRRYVANANASPAVDEENFRLLSGFNDIFVTIAAVLLLTAMAWIGNAAAPSDRSAPWPLGAVLVAASAWGLAEFFTRRRRMALPSIILLLAFVGAVFVGSASAIYHLLETFGSDFRTSFGNNESERGNVLIGSLVAICAAVTVGAAWLHWRRFRVPITVATGAVALVAGIIGVTMTSIPQARDSVLPLVFAGGLGLFALAMWWDMSDRERLTRRSDVAFWLHLAAAPMIAHSVFNGLGVFDGGIGAGTAVGVVGLYILFAIVALAIDRRALLVSSLVYVLYAMRTLFDQFGAVKLNVALTGLIIGSALLMLSAFWHPIRRVVIGGLPGDLRRYLPLLERTPAGAVRA